jgi:uncharacterized membrane protein YfcA
MKTGRLFVAIIKAIASMAGIFVIGYLGYHFPDAMIYMVTAAVLCAFSYYFYSKENKED